MLSCFMCKQVPVCYYHGYYNYYGYYGYYGHYRKITGVQNGTDRGVTSNVKYITYCLFLFIERCLWLPWKLCNSNFHFLLPSLQLITSNVYKSG